MIKPNKCECGASYIDFNSQIGKCPRCTNEMALMEVQQGILKKLTYLSEEVALKIVLRMLAEEKMQITRLSIEESRPKMENEPVKIKWYQKIFSILTKAKT